MNITQKNQQWSHNISNISLEMLQNVPGKNTNINQVHKKIKVKLKLSLCLTKHHAMKIYIQEVEVYLSVFLTLALDGG